jgi:hypothetical protein
MIANSPRRYKMLLVGLIASETRGIMSMKISRKWMKDFSKQLDQYKKDAEVVTKEINKLQAGNLALVYAQEDLEKALKRTLAPLKIFGVDVDKLTQRLQAFRTRLLDKKKALEDLSDSMEEGTGYINEYGQRWGDVLNVLQSKFPKATKAVVFGLRAMKVALITTGIGAIVVLVGLLISGLIALGNSLKSTTSELSKTERIGILFKATFDSLLGIVCASERQPLCPYQRSEKP